MRTETQFIDLITPLDNDLRDQLLTLFYAHGETMHSVGIRAANDINDMIQEKGGIRKESVVVNGKHRLTIYSSTAVGLVG